MTNPFDTSAFGGLGDFMGAAKPKPKNEPPMPQIRGKEFDGVLYVRAEDVADALSVLAPAANKRLIDKLRGYGKRRS